MKAELNPIKRVWKPKALAAIPSRAKFDIYGSDLPEPDVQEKNTDSVWDTCDALQAAEAAKAAKLRQSQEGVPNFV